MPKTLRDLETKVENAQEQLNFATLQLENQEARLKKLRSLVEKCVVRAPHGGRAIHFDVFWGEDFAIHEGSSVYQGQPLIYLPDMTKPVVEISLHETVGPRVRVGMSAKVRVMALPERELQGKVKSIDLLPTENWRAGLDIKHFPARITLETVPPGLLPNMSAEVRIITDTRDDVLVVPKEAVTVEGGRTFCYVVTGEHLDHRAVRVGRGDRTRLEVLGGLEQGERVVLNPAEHLNLPPEPYASPGMLSE